MEHFIKYVDIHNFKSIKDLKLEDCRRINIFLGYPNVGKSNVLEALSLFTLPYLNEGESLNKLVRVENKNELSYESDSVVSQRIKTNLEQITVSFPKIYRETKNGKLDYSFDEKLKLVGCSAYLSYNGNWIEDSKNSNVKRYTFQTNKQWKTNGDSQLLPPCGENIIDVLSYNNSVSDVKAWMKERFKKFGLEYVLDKSTNSLKVQKRLGGDEVFSLPYSSIADTLQRLIFYKIAIASNKNSVLLFEEPEAHAFPPYISLFNQDVIDAKSNQFFIVTHSPFVINDFLEYEHLRRETSIYLFDYKNNQTTAKRLTDKEMDVVYDYGIDLFFNIETFLEEK